MSCLHSHVGNKKFFAFNRFPSLFSRQQQNFPIILFMFCYQNNQSVTTLRKWSEACEDEAWNDNQHRRRREKGLKIWLCFIFCVFGAFASSSNGSCWTNKGVKCGELIHNVLLLLSFSSSNDHGAFFFFFYALLLFSLIQQIRHNVGGALSCDWFESWLSSSFVSVVLSW